MCDEASKTNRLRSPEFLATYLRSKVIDIGSGKDVVVLGAEPFDREHGDAKRILNFRLAASYDCVHSSHCLEHMADVPGALKQWWALVRPGGYMVLVVPDEELYEQGIWPSLFNSDHKASFRVADTAPTLPKSYNIRTLIDTLEDADIIVIQRQAVGYDYTLKSWGTTSMQDQKMDRGIARGTGLNSGVNLLTFS